MVSMLSEKPIICAPSRLLEGSPNVFLPVCPNGRWNERQQVSRSLSARNPEPVCVSVTVKFRFQWVCLNRQASEKWNGKPRLECVGGRHPPSKTPVGLLPWTCRSEGKWPSLNDWRARQSLKWLASRKIWCIEELETLHAGTKPRTSHHRSPGGERRWKRKR